MMLYLPLVSVWHKNDPALKPAAAHEPLRLVGARQWHGSHDEAKWFRRVHRDDGAHLGARCAASADDRDAACDQEPEVHGDLLARHVADDHDAAPDAHG